MAIDGDNQDDVTTSAEASAATETSAPKAPASATASSSSERSSFLHIEPNSEGLFGTDIIDEEAGENHVPERPYLRDGRRSRSFIAAFSIGLLAIAAGIVFLVVDEDANARMDHFFKGPQCPPAVLADDEHGNENCLQWFVEKDARRRLAQWKEEARRARHIYGEVTLNYFPQDSRVDVYQAMFKKDGKAWSRKEAGVGEMVCDAEYVETASDRILSKDLQGKKLCEKPLANGTADLKEKEFIERLPLRDLPIFETDKNTVKTDASGKPNPDLGKVISAYTYQYRIVFSREGYEPFEVVWRKQDWNRAPGPYFVNWPGLDLVVKPETLRENFVTAQRELWCYTQLNETSVAAMPAANKEMLFKRNGFKTEEDFLRTEAALTKGEFAEWWKAEEAKIIEEKCEEAPKKP